MSVSNVSGDNAQKVSGRTAHDKYIEKYARAPKSLIRDKEIDVYAFKVYCVLSQYVFQGNIARLGHRRIAKEANIHTDTVRRSLRKLAEREHIKVIGNGKRRRMYCLLSSIFSQKQRAGAKDVALGPSGTPRLVSAPRERIA